jgi:spermidine/putrescine ABC transporter ATP-binding subunit
MSAAAVTTIERGAALHLRNLTKRFGTTTAVDGITLDVPAGTFVSLLGPSGSGKTTTLNLIAGFLAADSGDILLDDRSVADVPPHKRNIGMVFQSYSLFPHMTVADNIGFPLRMRTSLARGDARQRIAAMLALVRLSGFEQRYPRQLSGGQQQRVAIARALVSRPRLLLMDEPLGALDKKLREQMQIEIKHIHRSVGTTVVYVTHDQDEALTMSDLVVVMHQSRIAQVGAPRALYEAPADAFVADFLGDSNLLAGAIVEASPERLALRIASGQVFHAAPGQWTGSVGDRAALLLRPEDMTLHLQAAGPAGADLLQGTVTEINYRGDAYRLAVAVGEETLKVKVAREEGAGLAPGQRVSLSWRSGAARILPAAAAGDAAGANE